MDAVKIESKVKTCHDCKIEKPISEFYLKRRSCKECVIKQTYVYKNRKRDPSVKEAKCVKCKVKKSPSEFDISTTTNLLKDICKKCRSREDSKFNFDPKRYELIEKWWDQVLVTYDKEGIEILKNIISTK
jgi:hypothetical protein